MPYLHLDLPGTYPVQVKRELATRLCKLYAEAMETQLWRPNVGIAELGKDNLYHLGSDGLEPITMVLVEFRRGRPPEKRLALGRAIVDICVELARCTSPDGHGRVLTAYGGRGAPRRELGCRLDPRGGSFGLSRTKEKSMSNSPSKDTALSEVEFS